MKNLLIVILTILALPVILVGIVVLIASIFGATVVVLAHLGWVIIIGLVIAVLYWIISYLIN